MSRGRGRNNLRRSLILRADTPFPSGDRVAANRRPFAARARGTAIATGMRNGLTKGSPT
jgi:hypothetical protein